MMLRFFAAMFLAGLLQAQRQPVEQAWDLLAKGERPQAIRLLEKAIQDNPRQADAHLLLGSVLMEEGRRDESIAHLRESVRLRPNSAEAQNALGEAHNTFDDPKSARASFEKSVELDPKLAVARVNLGMVLLQAGEMDTAAIHLDRAIALLGHSGDAAHPLYLRAKIYTERGQVEKASRALTEAVSLQPDFSEAWSDLGQARKTMLDNAGALTAFKRAVEISPADAVAQARLGTQYLAGGQAHAAVGHFQEAVRLSPSDQAALNGLQRALREDGEEQQAGEVKKKLAELLRAKDKSDQNSLIAVRLNNEGAALEKTGSLREAVEKYRQASELDPEHNGIRVNLAAALLRLGQWKEGLAQLRDAAKREPNNAVLKAALEDALTQAPVEFGGQGKSRTAPKPETKE
jgi:tetratricopeptide (TPR) repeat protein